MSDYYHEALDSYHNHFGGDVYNDSYGDYPEPVTPDEYEALAEDDEGFVIPEEPPEDDEDIRVGPYQSVNWMEQARCSDTSRDVFLSPGSVEAAKAICSTCVVVAPCFDYAVAIRAKGVWGGTTDAERARLMRGSDADLFERGKLLVPHAWHDPALRELASSLPSNIQAALQLLGEGHPHTKIAKTIGVSRQTIERWLHTAAELFGGSDVTISIPEEELKLSPAERAVYLLSRQGCSVEEIGAQLGLSTGAVYQRLSRGQKKLTS